MEPIIRFDRVSKRYRIGAQASFRETCGEFITRLTRRPPTGAASLSDAGSPETGRFLWALRDVSFELTPGHAAGIMGPNGAGKTTLLRLLAGITRPTRGHVDVRGRVGSLIELGAGFHPDLSGRDNIYLNGCILGMTRRDIRSKFERIVEFAELAPHLDTPVKRYSAGMYARLGFAVAAHVEPSILLVDEVLAVGDARFQSKCYRKIVELLSTGTTVLIVSHNPYVIRDYCQSALLLSAGQVRAHGQPTDVIRCYQTLTAGLEAEAPPGVATHDPAFQLALRITGPEVDDAGGIATVPSGAAVAFAIDYETATPVTQPVFGIDVYLVGGSLYASYSTDFDALALPPMQGRGTVVLRFDRFDFPVGTYRLGLVLSHGRQENHLLWRPDLAGFVVTQGTRSRGMFSLPHRWETTVRQGPGGPTPT